LFDRQHIIFDIDITCNYQVSESTIYIYELFDHSEHVEN